MFTHFLCNLHIIIQMGILMAFILYPPGNNYLQMLLKKETIYKPSYREVCIRSFRGNVQTQNHLTCNFITVVELKNKLSYCESIEVHCMLKHDLTAASTKQIQVGHHSYFYN